MGPIAIFIARFFGPQKATFVGWVGLRRKPNWLEFGETHFPPISIKEAGKLFSEAQRRARGEKRTLKLVACSDSVKRMAAGLRQKT